MVPSLSLSPSLPPSLSLSLPPHICPYQSCPTGNQLEHCVFLAEESGGYTERWKWERERESDGGENDIWRDGRPPHRPSSCYDCVFVQRSNFTRKKTNMYSGTSGAFYSAYISLWRFETFIIILLLIINFQRDSSKYEVLFWVVSDGLAPILNSEIDRQRDRQTVTGVSGVWATWRRRRKRRRTSCLHRSLELWRILQDKQMSHMDVMMYLWVFKTTKYFLLFYTTRVLVQE